MTPEPILQISGLSKSYGALNVLRGIDLTVRQGDVTFLIGPSGGGKSTLLRCINFLARPNSGEIRFDGQQLCHQAAGKFQVAPEKVLRKARTEMPMVFQHFNLFSHRTALENVIEGPVHVQRRPAREVIEEAMETLAMVGLAEKRDHYPDQLSGGQKQRVAIARALAMKPKLILFDEPTSALDPELVSGVLDTIRSLAERGMTLIVVSHEMNFARKLANTIHFVCEGIVMESGAPEEIFGRPKSERLTNFIRTVSSH
ncbi:MAG: amino acid ABC transporter ATP-binding protein [Mesorhizobium sp.]|nr:amino acid ABC transporter ATP-binding protein [Mesorhizobium sp.]